MATVRGLQVLFRVSSTRTVVGVITKVVSGDTVNLVALTDMADDWPVSGVPATTHPCQYYASVAKGTDEGEWQECEVSDPIAAAIASAIEGRAAAPTAGSSVSLALNTARKPSASRPTRVIVSGTWTWSLAALGSVAGAVSFDSDASATPATSRGSLPFSRTLTLGVVAFGATEPWQMSYDVPADEYYKISTSGAGTFAIVHIEEQPL